MDREAVLFDFDYTLGDSTPGIIQSIQYALARLGEPSPPPERIRRTIGLSRADTYLSLTGDTDERRSALFGGYFKEKADQVMVEHTRLYPEALPALASLRAKGFRLGIVTTKYRYRVQAILAREAAEGRVDVVIGAEDVQRQKPDPEGLLLAMAALGAAPRQTLYVGDSLVDAEAAARAGTRFLGVLTGTTTAADFARKGQPAARGLVEVLAIIGQGGRS